MAEIKDEVGAVNPRYWEVRQKRDIYNDLIEGTVKMREKRKVYLPKFPAETDEDYKSRCDTATLFNLTLKTRNMMTGLVFKDPIELSPDVDEQIVELWENIDNGGNHGDVFCQMVFADAFQGYSAILVDAPTIRAESREEQIRMNLRPYWVHYDADSIWNWRYEINERSKARELTLIVLREESAVPAGQFTTEPAVYFRVFRKQNELVGFTLYREIKSDSGKVEYVIEQEGTLPQLSQIPVAIVWHLGADPLLMDIAIKNVEHFQTYSDYKQLVHKTCVPIPVGKGVEMTGAGQIVVGGSTMMQTSADGDFGFAEVNGSSLSLIRQSLQDIRDDIALMGLALLADKTSRVDFTATEALLNNVAETSELRMFARSMQDAIELALGFTAEYLLLPKEAGGSVELGTQWKATENQYNIQLDELNKRADIANKLSGIMSQQWILSFLGVTNEDEVKEILDQLASETPLLLEGEAFNAPVVPLAQTAPTIDIEEED
jgi:hypothetical protein